MSQSTKLPSSFFEISAGFMVREKDSCEYSIELPILPFMFEEEETITSIRLNRVDFKTANLNWLSDKDFEFSANPEPGYIDASVYLGGIHNPVDVKKISFSKILRFRSISFTSIDFEVDFIFELIDLENIHKSIKTNIIIYNGS
jgi:hypothetical protein